MQRAPQVDKDCVSDILNLTSRHSLIFFLMIYLIGQPKMIAFKLKLKGVIMT